MPVNMNPEEAAAFSRLEVVSKAQLEGAAGSASELLLPNDRQLLISHANKIGEQPANLIERAGLQRAESIWIASTLGAIDPAKSEAPFRSDELNKIYETQQRFESQLHEKMNSLDKSAALDVSR